ncbi:unnamed protein product [Mytilus edulis]|uniref:Uncharacterized protein n=1 Tax=Mytilus edulis TaxID=6550 RepID=A0A8S3PR90_MYTED|nr:unnamed protein product [Mytilus edulis]
MEADLHQRPSQTLSDDIDTDVPLGEEAYEAEIENNGDILEPPKVLVDPGPFLYNRRVCVVALPVFLLMLSMVGETLVLLICFGLAVLLCVDNKGLHQSRTIMLGCIYCGTNTTYPFLLAFIGFVFLQLFMAPTTSSFRKPKSEEDNCNILKVASLTAISVIYCTLPTILQIVIHVVHRSQMFHISFVTEVIFLSMTQIFLLTLMSIRPLVEALGHDHSLVVKLRWLSGASATILCYPVLMHLGISSHFLPWLPAAIGTYSNTFKLIFGLPLPAVYVMMLTNAVLCLLIGYVGSHGRQEMFSVLVCIQTVVFVCCETVLYDAGLYRWQLFIITCVIAAYTFQRNKSPCEFTGHLGLLCVSVIVNANPLIYVLSSYIFMTESAASDIAGLCSMVCGVLIIIAQSIHVPEDLRVRYTGVLVVSRRQYTCRQVHHVGCGFHGSSDLRYSNKRKSSNVSNITIIKINFMCKSCYQHMSKVTGTQTEPKDDKEVPYLPTIGNIATFISFVMICLMAPTSSFFHDVWCCGASLVLVCLQKDMRIFSSLREDNQTTATKITSLVILVTATLYRSDIWNYNSSWMFARATVLAFTTNILIDSNCSALQQTISIPIGSNCSALQQTIGIHIGSNSSDLHQTIGIPIEATVLLYNKQSAFPLVATVQLYNKQSAFPLLATVLLYNKQSAFPLAATVQLYSKQSAFPLVATVQLNNKHSAFPLIATVLLYNKQSAFPLVATVLLYNKQSTFPLIATVLLYNKHSH